MEVARARVRRRATRAKFGAAVEAFPCRVRAGPERRGRMPPFRPGGADRGCRQRTPGMVSVRVVPSPGVLRAVSVPPCASAMRRASGSPRPTPPVARARLRSTR